MGGVDGGRASILLYVASVSIIYGWGFTLILILRIAS